MDALVHVAALSGQDAQELEELVQGLRDDLLDLDVDSVNPVAEQDFPDGAKGLGSLAGWLAVRFGTVDGLRALVGAVRGWASRTGRTVEVTYGSDVLKLTGATSAQQEKIIDAWIARHVSDA